MESRICRRLLVERPGTLVVASARPASLGESMVEYTSWPRRRTSGDTSRVDQRQGVSRLEWESDVWSEEFCSVT